MAYSQGFIFAVLTMVAQPIYKINESVKCSHAVFNYVNGLCKGYTELNN